MSDKAVELNVAGTSCRVVTTADEEELQQLASMVEDKLEGILAPGRPVTTQAMLLAAVALANDVREERARADAIAKRAKSSLDKVLKRVDSALADSDLAAIKERSKKSRSKKRGKRGGGDDDGAG